MTRKKCSRCGSPVKGHKGPAGARCQNVDPDGSEPPHNPGGPPAPDQPPDLGNGGKGPLGGPDGSGNPPAGPEGKGGGGDGAENPPTDPLPELPPPQPPVIPQPNQPSGQVPATPGLHPNGHPGLAPMYGAEPPGGPQGAFGGAYGGAPANGPYGSMGGAFNNGYGHGPWLPGTAGSYPPSSYHHPGQAWYPYGQSQYGMGPQMAFPGSAGPRFATPHPGGTGIGGGMRVVNPQVDWSDVGASITACGAMLTGQDIQKDQASMTAQLKNCIDKLNNAMSAINPDQSKMNNYNNDNHLNYGPVPPPSGGHVHHFTSNSQMAPMAGMEHMYGNQHLRSNRNPYQPGTMSHKLKAQGVSSKTIEAALEGDFVDLADFLPPIGASNNVSNLDLECFLDNESKSVSYRPKKYTRKINSHDTWSQAWVAYEKLLVSHFGASVHEYLADYRATILDYSKKYMWSAVAVYDFRHRSRLATQVTLSERLNFSIIFNDLSNTILDTTAIRQNATRCQRCKAYDHMVRDCPFSEGWKGGQNQSKTQTKNETQEICYNFNRDKCSGDRCKRKHICRHCRGPLPYTKCSVSGPCSGKSGVPT